MKFPIICIIIALCTIITGCGNETINGIKYSSYGLVNAREMKNPNVQYEVSAMSVVVSVVLVETLVVPLYCIGWDWYEPVRIKNSTWVKGQVG